MSKGWGILFLLSMVVFFGVTGTDLTPGATDRRQDKASTGPRDDNEGDSHPVRKRHSLFHRPKGTSLESMARREELPREKDLANEFESISPIRIIVKTNYKVDVSERSESHEVQLDLLKNVATKEQQSDVLASIRLDVAYSSSVQLAKWA